MALGTAAVLVALTAQVQGYELDHCSFLQRDLHAFRRKPQESTEADTTYVRSLPLNSASAARQGGRGLVLDRVLLLLSLLLPCAIFALLHFTEERRRNAHEMLTDGLAKRPLAHQASAYGSCCMEEGESSGLKLFGEDGGGEAVPGSANGSTRDFLSGVAIALGCLPEAISFSFITGVSPLNGIWAGVFMGLCSSLVGGRPGLISCASAATAIVLKEVSLDPACGLGAMGLTVLLCGVIQGVCGAFRFSRFITLVPHTVMIGFVNGIAIIMCTAQINQFRVAGAGTPFVDGSVLRGMVATAVVALVAAIAFPQIPRVGHLLPAPLVAIACAILFGACIDSWSPGRTLVQVAGGQAFQGGFASMPPFNFPPVGVHWSDWGMWSKVLLASVRMAMVGLIESLLTLILVDQITETRGSTTRECFGQALGNTISGLFGVQGGCALIGQTLLNVGAGARGRLSGFTMAVGLASSVVLFGGAVGRLPVAALVGVMLLVAGNTFAWGCLRLLVESRVRWVDGAVIISVTVATVCFDLATAVLFGILFSAVVFAWDTAADVKVEEWAAGQPKRRTFVLHGPLFFGSSLNFQRQIRPECIPEAGVTLDFSHGKVLDHSGLDAIVKTVDRCRAGNKSVECIGLPVDAWQYVEAMSTLAGCDDRASALGPAAGT